MSVPRQKPGKSRQNYATPREFIHAVEGHFGPLGWDLAAEPETTVVPCRYWTKADDSLTKNWSALHSYGLPGEWLWLNPEFADIETWAKKCADECANGARILMLVPASVGTCWFRDHVLGKAMVWALNPRMSFDGVAPYPKDLMLCVYSRYSHGFDQWRWKESSR